MSIEEKQSYLREAILEKGINPNDFFEHWSTLEIQLQDVPLERLKQVVMKFLEKNPVNLPQKQQNNDQEQQFSDFQDAEQKQSVKSEYADFNWDFLSAKHHPIADSKPLINKQSENTAIKSIIEVKPIAKSTVQPRQIKQNKVQRPKIIEKIIDQVDQTPNYRQFNELPLQNINPKDERSLTVKEVLQSSKLQTLKCLKLQQNVLSHHINVQIDITNVEQIEEKTNALINKFIKSTHLLFTIKSIARNKNRSIGISWEVKRQPQDFEWLRNMLVKFYPGVVVPPLPTTPKSKEKIFGYQKKLQHFLKDCYRCPELKNSKYYQVFLSYSNSTDFDSFVKNSQNSSKPKTLSHILNMTGVVETLYSDNIQQYGQGLQNYLNKTSAHLKQVKNILNQINASYEKISQEYKNLANVFFEMSDQSHSFSEEKCYQRLANTYKQIAILSEQHSNFGESQKEFIDAFMQSHFAYEKDRLDNMQGLIAKRALFASELTKKSKQQESKGGMFGKIASFFGEKAQSVDIPSSNYQTLNNQVGYYNNQLLRESVRCIEVMVQSHINHFSGYGHSRIDNVDKMQKIWSTILVELSKLNAMK